MSGVPTGSGNYKLVPVILEPLAKETDKPIDQIVPMSEECYAVKAGRSVYTWGRISGNWTKVHTCADEKFRIEALPSGHIFAYWDRPQAAPTFLDQNPPQGNCWSQYQILEIDSSNRHSAPKISELREVPDAVISLALLSPKEIICVAPRDHQAGYKLQLWDPHQPYDNATTIKPHMNTARAAPVKSVEALLSQPLYPTSVNDSTNTVALWQESGHIHFLTYTQSRWSIRNLTLTAQLKSPPLRVWSDKESIDAFSQFTVSTGTAVWGWDAMRQLKYNKKSAQKWAPWICRQLRPLSTELGRVTQCHGKHFLAHKNEVSSILCYEVDEKQESLVLVTKLTVNGLGPTCLSLKGDELIAPSKQGTNLRVWRVHTT